MFDVSNIGLDTIPHLQCWTNKTIKLKIPASVSWVPTVMGVWDPLIYIKNVLVTEMLPFSFLGEKRTNNGTDYTNAELLFHYHCEKKVKKFIY